MQLKINIHRSYQQQNTDEKQTHYRFI